MPDNFWLLFLANLPIVAVVIWALHKRFLVMGVTHTKEMDEKDKEIAFREVLRQESLVDKAALQSINKDMISSINELRAIVTQSLDLNDRLLNENLGKRWEDSDRRPKA